MKNHKPKKCNLYYYLSTDSFQLQPGALDGVGWMKKGGGEGRAENRHCRATIPTPLKEYLRMDS